MRPGAVAHGAVRVANAIADAAIALVLLALFALGCYALWDSHQVDQEASQAQWQPYRPTEESQLSFAQLQAINPDVHAWLALYGTHVDYPVCASDDMDTYLFTNARGEYSLSGSLFVDPGCAPDFTDPVTIVYGHHMEDDAMFGQIDDFADATFFREHEHGSLYAGGRTWGLYMVAYLTADAYDASVYRTGLSAEDLPAYVAQLEARSTQARQVEVGAGDRVVVMSTCATDGTNARSLLVAKVTSLTYQNPHVHWPNTGTGVDGVPGPLGLPWLAWAALALLAALALVAAVAGRRRRERRESTEEEGRTS